MTNLVFFEDLNDAYEAAIAEVGPKYNIYVMPRGNSSLPVLVP